MNVTIKKVFGTGLLVALMAILAGGNALAYGGPFEPIPHLNSMIATVNSSGAPSSLKNELSKKLENMIKLVQKDKDDKSVLKMERFKNDLEKMKKGQYKHYKDLPLTDRLALIALANEYLANM